MVRASRSLLLLMTAAVAACSAPAGDDETASAALTSSVPTCQLREADLDGALFADLKDAVAPSFSTATTVSVPGALNATAAGGFTRVVTVLAATSVLDDDPPPAPSALDIMGEAPDSHHADRTAHRLYDAMTRATEDAEGTRVSPNGRVECEIIGWKGGNLYHCTLRGLITMSEVTEPSSICRP